MSQKPHKEQCGSACGTVTTERNRYFTGKYMTARDFAGEQDYFLSRQRLHNRLLHGWGIVCGLRVLHHPRADQDECHQRWLVVKAGVAIDCCGREVFVPEDIPLEVPVEDLPPLGEYPGNEVPPVEDPPPLDEDPGNDEPPDKDDDESGSGEDDREKGERKDSKGYKSKNMASRGLTRRERRHPRRPRSGRDDDNYDEDHDHDHGHDHGHGHDHDHGPGHWPVNGLLLCVHYAEEEIEPVPTLYAEGQCDPQHHEANRVREVARFSFKRLDEVESDCWRMPGGWHGHDTACKDDCDEPLPGPSGGCIEPDCPCGGCIPLALLFENENGEIEGVANHQPLFEIDLRGRRHLRPPPHYLTHVIGTNWPHGGEVTLHELREHMGGQLKLTFDRKIQPQVPYSTGTGVNRRTFTAEYGGIQRGMEFLSSPEDDEPRLKDDGCTAVYSIADEFLRGRDNIADNFVYVTLRCDFVLDCHEMPVDGNHLAGRLPSGSGIPGGDFVSWFRVVHDHHHEDEEIG